MKQDVHSDSFARLEYDDSLKCLELVWQDTTVDMSDEDFRRWLEVFALKGKEFGASYMLVDGRSFKHEMTSELNAWRQEVIIPMYNSAGVRKFAFLLTQVAETDTEPRPEPGAEFPTAYFDSRDQIEAWFDA
jgi:hypothetical protein